MISLNQTVTGNFLSSMLIFQDLNLDVNSKVPNTGKNCWRKEIPEFHVFHAKANPPSHDSFEGGFCSQISSGLGRKRAAEERRIDRIDSMHLMNPNDHHLV